MLDHGLRYCKNCTSALLMLQKCSLLQLLCPVRVLFATDCTGCLKKGVCKTRNDRADANTDDCGVGQS